MLKKQNKFWLAYGDFCRTPCTRNTFWKITAVSTLLYKACVGLWSSWKALVANESYLCCEVLGHTAGLLSNPDTNALLQKWMKLSWSHAPTLNPALVTIHFYCCKSWFKDSSDSSDFCGYCCMIESKLEITKFFGNTFGLNLRWWVETSAMKQVFYTCIKWLNFKMHFKLDDLHLLFLILCAYTTSQILISKIWTPFAL